MASSNDSKLEVVFGDLLSCKEDYLCHQCNCTSKKSAGLAQKIFQRFPSTNDYVSRGDPSEPGTVSVHHLERYYGGPMSVINMFAQRGPGKARPWGDDSKEMRLTWFTQCLYACLDKTPRGSKFAFPFGIGCGLAGGSWDSYFAILKTWSEDFRVGKVVIYHLTSGRAN